MSWGRLGSHGQDRRSSLTATRFPAERDLFIEAGGAGCSGVEVPQRNPPVPHAWVPELIVCLGVFGW